MLLETLQHMLPVIAANFTARLPGFSFKTGARWLQENSAGNRVVFVPIRDSWDAGRQQRGVSRVIRVRIAHVNAVIWGVATKLDGSIYKHGETIPLDSNGLPNAGRYDRGQVEAAINALICAIEDSCTQADSPGGGPQWDLEDGMWREQEGEDISEYGQAYVLPFSIRIPVVYDELVTAPVTTQSIGYIEDDSSITTPPP